MSRPIFVVITLAVCASPAFADGTLTLRGAIRTALVQSPRLRQPDDATELAAIRASQSNAQFGIKATPTLTSGSDPLGNAMRTFGLGVSKRLPTGGDVQFSATSFRYGATSEFRDSGYSVNLSQPLFRGFGATTAAERALARRGVASAERSAADARRALVVSTTEAYLAVLRQRHQSENAQRALDRARQLRTASDARSRIGLATELDVLRADLLSARAEASLASAGEQYEAACDSLRALLGLGIDDAIDVAEEDLSDVGLVASGLAPDDVPAGGAPAGATERLTEKALRSRLDLLEARDRIADARRTESISRWNLLPQTAMNVSYNRRGLYSSTDLFGPLLNGWRFSFSSWYALDRSAEQSTAAIASLGVRAAADDAAVIERRVRTEVRQAYHAWVRTGTTIDIQTRAVELARRQQRLAELRYERGVAGNFDVVDAENLLFQALSDLEAARSDRALSALNLRRVSGQLEPERFQP